MEILIFDSNYLESTQCLYKKYFINKTNGYFVYNSSYTTTNFIKINENNIIRVEGVFSNNSGAVYDENFNYIQGLDAVVSNKTFTMPTSAKYIRIGFETAGGLKIYAQLQADSDITGGVIEDVIFDSSSSVLAVKQDYTINMNNGTDLSSAGNCCLSEYLSVTPNSKLLIKSISPNSMGAFYTDTGTYIIGLNYSNIKEHVSVPANATKLKFGWAKASDMAFVSVLTDRDAGTNPTVVDIVLDKTNITLAENETSTFSVKLSNSVTDSKTVTASVNNGYCTLDKTTLTFTSENYSEYQVVTVTGVHVQNNYTDTNSIINVTSTDSTTKTINVLISNIDEKEEPVTPVTNSNSILYKYIRANIKTLIYKSGSKNAYDTIENSFINYNTGFSATITGMSSTDFIEVSEGDELEITGHFSTSLGAFYDKDKNFISGIKGEASVNDYKFTIGAGVKYVRIGYYSGCSIYVTKITSNNLLDDGIYLETAKVIYGNISISNLFNEFNSRKSFNSKLKGKIWDVYGDSITESNYRALENYHYFVKKDLGINKVNNYGVSGYCFKDVSTKIDASTTQPDVITVFCGTNDFGGVSGNIVLGNVTDTSTTESVCGKIRLVIEKLLAKYPTTPIGFITPLPRSTGNSIQKQTNNAGYTMEQLVDCIVKICSEYSIPILDLYRKSGLRPWLAENNKKYFSCTSAPSGDGLHPNVLAHENFLAPKILAFLENM